MLYSQCIPLDMGHSCGFRIFSFNYKAITDQRVHFVKLSGRKFPKMILTKSKYPHNPNIEFVSRSESLKFFYFRCIVDNKNTTPFQILLGVGVCFLILSALSTFFMKSIKPKVLVCEYPNIFKSP